jgi:two-component system cell cycle sensor histidine kinase/response regulator CckA
MEGAAGGCRTPTRPVGYAFGRRQLWRPRVLEADVVIREIAPVLRRTIGDYSALVLALDSPGIRIRLDRGQLEQTLLNLAMNARDAMPDGGEVTLATRPVQLGTDVEGAPPGIAIRPGPYLRLDVRETGEGMDSETFVHLFEPFFTTKLIGKGTGLGLASVYGIVKQAHGYVWATRVRWCSSWKTSPVCMMTARGLQERATPS